MLHLIRRLVNVPSYSGNSLAIARCLDLCREFLFRSPGIHLQEFEKNGCQSLIFSNAGGLEFDVISPCHIDVAPAEIYEMRIDGYKIFGRGVLDMKSFVASGLTNLREMARWGYNSIRYAIVITSDEEVGGRDGMGYLVKDIGLRTHLVLDSDDGWDIHNVIRENLGAATIEFTGEKQGIERTILNIKNEFIGYHCEDYGREMDINFIGNDMEKRISGCLEDTVAFRILMLHNYREHNIFGNHHRLYRQVAKRNGLTLDYGKSSGINDSRYFFDQDSDIISHQATGGDRHRETEWLDLRSLYKFNGIQREFLMELDRRLRISSL
ncbi:MAG: M20/M25/M40 family metallo-hydrolase [Rickettsiales bacterium]|jgi:hypothetical protein|nr:M20/M25/M40 family metallo-hydrolase [Rickettsiales bacterium]